MERVKVAVSGADGQLGQALRSLAGEQPGLDLMFFSRKELAVDDPRAVRSFFGQENPSYFVNCAAYTAVDRAESEKEEAFRINGEAVGFIASMAAQAHSRLIHISTDYVFDGNSRRPLREEDPTSPINVYGASKLRGEELAFRANPETLILRTAWVYHETGQNFLRTMIRLMGERKEVRVVMDQLGSPTYAGDLAEAILKIISGGNFLPGLYHYSNHGFTSWFGFAEKIREAIRSSCRLVPIPSSEYPTPARRPFYSLLDKSKIELLYKLKIPAWESSLGNCLARMNYH
jgi:dTDP-4-dehydrorhamnose reductase